MPAGTAMSRGHKARAETPAITVSPAGAAPQSKALCIDSAMSHEPRGSWSSYVPGVSFPETHLLAQCSHREFTPIYANALTQPVDQPLSLQPLQQQPWPGSPSA